MKQRNRKHYEIISVYPAPTNPNIYICTAYAYNNLPATYLVCGDQLAELASTVGKPHLGQYTRSQTVSSSTDRGGLLSVWHLLAHYVLYRL